MNHCTGKKDDGTMLKVMALGLTVLLAAVGAYVQMAGILSPDNWWAHWCVPAVCAMWVVLLGYSNHELMQRVKSLDQHLSRTRRELDIFRRAAGMPPWYPEDADEGTYRPSTGGLRAVR